MNKQLTAGRDRRTTVAIAAGLCALAMLMWLAVGQTRAAFVDNTENPDNTFTTGTVEISTSQPGSALFDFTGMLPGHTRTQTITVSNMSTAPLGVRLFADDYVPPTRAGSELADNLDVLVEIVETADAPAGSGAIVFDGTMAEFAAADDWTCGWWTDYDAQECNPTPPPTPEQPGPLERILRKAIPDTMEDAAPFDEDFWDQIAQIDDDYADEQPVALLWAKVPQTVKDDIKDADEDTYDAIETAVENSPASPLVTAANVVAPTPTPSPTTSPAEKTYPELGDRLEEVNEDGSEAIYRITVTLASDAGSADVAPDDSISITFVWEGRA